MIEISPVTNNSVSSIDYATESFFSNTGVVKGCYEPITIRFETLILEYCQKKNKNKPFDWYKELDIDKSNASRIRRGLIIPPNWLKIKISNWFGVDSRNIWNSNSHVAKPIYPPLIDKSACENIQDNSEVTL